MSVRTSRLSSDYEKEISKILARNVKDNNLKLVNITGCDITSDLSFAKVYYTVFDSEKKKEIKEGLEKSKSFIRGELSKRINVRHTPELRFIYDESVAYGEEIEKIIQNINSKEK